MKATDIAISFVVISRSDEDDFAMSVHEDQAQLFAFLDELMLQGLKQNEDWAVWRVKGRETIKFTTRRIRVATGFKEN